MRSTDTRREPGMSSPVKSSSVQHVPEFFDGISLINSTRWLIVMIVVDPDFSHGSGGHEKVAANWSLRSQVCRPAAR
jgi:hypothetical protein